MKPKLTWFRHHEGCYDMALIGGSSLRLYFVGYIAPLRLVEFNGVDLGFASDQAGAEEKLKEYCNNITARLEDK